MHYLKDTLLRVLILLILISMGAFLGGYLPYPIGLLVLSLFLVARLAHLHGGKS